MTGKVLWLSHCMLYIFVAVKYDMKVWMFYGLIIHRYADTAALRMSLNLLAYQNYISIWLMKILGEYLSISIIWNLCDLSRISMQHGIIHLEHQPNNSLCYDYNKIIPSDVLSSIWIHSLLGTAHIINGKKTPNRTLEMESLSQVVN